ncbi:MAG: 2-oxoacid:acceptor oxidoreductase subunit alpha, partial [Desulfovibrionales bacterium]
YLFTKAIIRTGYEVVVTQDYMSRVRGGHNTFCIRMSPEPVFAPKEPVDVLVALNEKTVRLHKDKLSERGLIVVDQGVDTGDAKVYKVPFEELAPKPIFFNTVALGVLASTVCEDINVLENLLRDTFKKKGEEVVQQNLEVLRNAYEWQKGQNDVFECPAPAQGNPDRLTMQGNEAIALGALAAGCNFCSFYPMTPSTSVALNLIGKGGPLGLVSEQAEDEIAALNMALGASYAGARVLVPTSGGGFALMTEAVSLAGMTETPVVIVLAQRPGPATGLPTRTEQGDLFLALHSGHGDFPRAILAPGTVEECFHLTHRAFGLAERYQSPVFVLTDQFLADSYRAVEPFDLESLPKLPAPLLEVDNPEEYVRYAVTEDGVSPRVIPGFSEAVVVVDSDEHTPDGHITEDFGVRVDMVEKRNRKGQGLVSEIVPPTFDGPDDPETLFVCWGSSLGAVKETCQRLQGEGKRAALVHFSQIWPLDPEHFLGRFKAAGQVVFVEGNFSGQFAALVRMETGYVPDRKILRYDGLPFTPAFILEQLQKSS